MKRYIMGLCTLLVLVVASFWLYNGGYAFRNSINSTETASPALAIAAAWTIMRLPYLMAGMVLKIFPIISGEGVPKWHPDAKKLLLWGLPFFILAAMPYLGWFLNFPNVFIWPDSVQNVICLLFGYVLMASLFKVRPTEP